ncbi:MAG: hypothetical protein IKW70_09725 [Verrucomicrobia bacterium]|nr:hypothetical protein [Verrucomicrobiota bacterium]MBR5738337.1 hypothetical protein [Verrucomicrobiota bacterium]MBR6464405.1 hypothetical protein [Verrucomicrobiota bacterium]
MERQQLLFTSVTNKKTKREPRATRSQARWWFEQIFKAIEEAAIPEVPRLEQEQPLLPLK